MKTVAKRVTAERLPLTVRYAEDENARALLCRLAVRRGSLSLCEFVDASEIEWSPFMGGDYTNVDIDLISKISGIDGNSIKKSTSHISRLEECFNRVPLNYFIHRPIDFCEPRPNRICTVCLVSDLDSRGGPEECRPYRRFWWDFGEFDVCPEHHVPLVERCTHCTQLLSYRNLRPDRCVCGHSLLENVEAETCHGVEAELLSWLRSASPPSWAHGLSLYGACGLALTLGTLDVMGPTQVSPESLPARQRAELTLRGVELLAGGEARIREVLNTASKNYDIWTLKVYGAVFEWLSSYNHSELDFVRNIIVEDSNKNPKIHWNMTVDLISDEAKSASYISHTNRNDLRALRNLLGLSARKSKRLISIYKFDVEISSKNERYFLFRKVLSDYRKHNRENSFFKNVSNNWVKLKDIAVSLERWADAYLMVLSGEIRTVGWLVGDHKIADVLIRKRDFQRKFGLELEPFVHDEIDPESLNFPSRHSRKKRKRDGNRD